MSLSSQGTMSYFVTQFMKTGGRLGFHLINMYSTVVEVIMERKEVHGWDRGVKQRPPNL